MTFIVSKIIDGKFVNHSDSMITELKLGYKKNEFSPNLNSFSSILKTVILYRDLCVFYAGNVGYAEIALKEILKNEKIKIADVIEILKKYSLQQNGKTIFGLSFINQDGNILQAQISNGILYDFTNSLMWLGDVRAYDIFKEKNQEFLQLDKSETESIQLAFTDVLTNGNIEGVGHFDISTSSSSQQMKQNGNVFTQNVFKYDLKLDFRNFTSKNISFSHKNEYRDIPLDLENDNVGGFSYFTSHSPYKFGVAIYNFEEKKDYYYAHK